MASFLIDLFCKNGGEKLSAALQSHDLITSKLTCTSESYPSFLLWDFSFILTSRGFENFDNVIDYLYIYIDLFKQQGLSSDIYDEKKTLSILDFYYNDDFDIKSES